MKKTLNCLLSILACALALASTPARVHAAQEPPPDAVAIPGEELMIAYYTPRTMRAQTLAKLAEELFGKRVYVQKRSIPGQDGGASWVDHFLVVDDTILIRDGNDRVLTIRAELERLEESLHPPEEPRAVRTDAELVDFQYEPRHVSTSTLQLALARFNRSMNVGPPRGQSGPYVQAMTITSLPERNLLLVHDTPEQVEAIKAFIAGIDQPTPQVTITYFVVIGYSEPPVTGLRAAPAELAQNLERLVPAKHYHMELSGVLRSSVSGKMVVEDASRPMQIGLEPASFSMQDGVLTLESCRFEYQKRAFSTSATLRKGEYTVLGAAGEQPVFLVLRLAVD